MLQRRLMIPIHIRGSHRPAAVIHRGKLRAILGRDSLMLHWFE